LNPRIFSFDSFADELLIQRNDPAGAGFIVEASIAASKIKNYPAVAAIRFSKSSH
jgi:L-rhamnose isomerase